jgi:tetratricopeptide (TPR) repeat protein
LEQQSGRAAEAMQAWETLLELDPALGEYRQALSQLHHEQGDPDQACAEAEINVVWFPEDPLKWGWYAALLLEWDRPQQALEAVAAAQAFAPELAALEELADQARAALAHQK